MTDFSRLEFVSVLDEDKQNPKERVYSLNIKMTPKKGGKVTNMSKILPLVEAYDNKGYLHRYIVKEFLDESLTGIKQFSAKKK